MSETLFDKVAGLRPITVTPKMRPNTGVFVWIWQNISEHRFLDASSKSNCFSSKNSVKTNIAQNVTSINVTKSAGFRHIYWRNP